MHPKDWLPGMLRAWAKQKRRIMTGRENFPDGAVHEDGWAKMSVAAFGTEGRSTGGCGPHGQRYEEVYSGDALIIWRALADAPIEVREVLFAHYVIAGVDAKTKAKMLEVSPATSWARLDHGYYFLAGRLDRDAGVRASAREQAPP